RNAVALLLALLALLALGACGKGDGKKPATQVAAKVNSEEISVHQVNRVIERLARADPGRATPGQVLERIIDEELLVQKAREAKLDRDPRVVQAIQDSQRHILVQAYVDKAIGAARSTPEEAKPIIERALAMRKGAEHAEADLKRLRGKASIEYVGDFKVARDEAPPTAVQAAVPGAKSAGHMEKGISSLR